MARGACSVAMISFTTVSDSILVSKQNVYFNISQTKWETLKAPHDAAKGWYRLDKAGKRPPG
jgi:hypothetical protein